MIKVLTFGVFDYFHLGHLRLFKNAKKYGDYLIVAVQDGGFVLKNKPKANILYSTEQRIELVEAIKDVDEVIIYQDVDKTVPNVVFDILVIGEDQVHDGFKKAEEWCKTNSKEVIHLARTPGISSTDVKERLAKLQ